MLVYKINRRPLGDPMLFKGPKDFLKHLNQVMSRDVVAKSGRRHQREWRIGNLSRSDGALTGMLGWSRHGEAMSNIYDSETKTWRDTVVPNDVAAVAPFSVLAGSRYLGVLKHPSFAETTVAKVFTELLNRGEATMPTPTTAWSVDAVGDRQHFEQWLSSVDRVVEMKFIFERPNPDAEESFRFLFDRLDTLGAEQIVDRVTPIDKEAGLNKEGIREDRISQAYIAAAMMAFGYVVGRGYRGNQKANYDQRRAVLRERVTGVGPTWDDAKKLVVKATRRAVGRRRRDG